MVCPRAGRTRHHDGLPGPEPARVRDADRDAHDRPGTSAGHGIAEWRARGRLSVFHYAEGATRDVGFALYEDAAAYDAQALPVPVPALVFQGRQDASVDPAMVERWAATQPQVDLRLLDDDHQLTASVETMWLEIRRFLRLEPMIDESSRRA